VEDWLTLAQAALAIGTTPDTIRRKIRRGELLGRKVDTPYGPAWQVNLHAAGQGVAVDHGDPVATSAPWPDDAAQGGRQHAGESVALLDALQLVRELQQQNVELAGRVGFYQSELANMKDQLKALQAPKEEPPVEESLAMVVPADALPRAPWWRRWFQP
jgi:hypothetical protein